MIKGWPGNFSNLRLHRKWDILGSSLFTLAPTTLIVKNWILDSKSPPFRYESSIFVRFNFSWLVMPCPEHLGWIPSVCPSTELGIISVLMAPQSISPDQLGEEAYFNVKQHQQEYCSLWTPHSTYCGMLSSVPDFGERRKAIVRQSSISNTGEVVGQKVIVHHVECCC